LSVQNNALFREWGFVMNSVVSYYNQFDEWGRLDREPIEFKVNWHYINHYLPAEGKVLDNGAGPGKYSMKLAEKRLQVTLTDLTPRFVRMAEEMADELGLRKQFDGFHTADARWLSALEDQFDPVLMLGPMYHLQGEHDRVQAA
jgi:2-polyprenyl-3-methyl-5-hydroxy-6-metoxy-1,4-benzoquinol methylase